MAMRAADPQKLDALVGRLVGDVGVSITGALVVLGDQLGLYKAMADGKPMTSQELAAKTGFKERYIREWLSGQAAADYIEYDAESDKFNLSPEQAMAFAEEDSPAFFAGAFEIVQSMWVDEPKVETAFRSGAGLGWHEHSKCLFRGTERFFRPGYNTNLKASWIPALDGVEAKLMEGATVADVGCGHGASTILMAQAYPKSRFYAFDYHGPSIEKAREEAGKAGVADRITFERASAKDFPAKGYDLVAMFDCLHDMGDPVGAGRHVRETLAKDGTWMIVEPFANDQLKDNLNPIGRIFYGASTMICTPASQSQEVGLCLGAQAGEMRLRKVALDAGFSHFRRATETPFNMVFEARA
jgi:2-polyprenyl-3-methyl-5-hydroxy-6-metoxy-1,4-benzoquinol methylase